MPGYPAPTVTAARAYTGQRGTVVATQRRHRLLESGATATPGTACTEPVQAGMVSKETAGRLHMPESRGRTMLAARECGATVRATRASSRGMSQSAALSR